MSQQAKEMLERYRAAESLGSDARARMLSGLRAKIAVGGPGVGASKVSLLKPALSKLLAAGKTKIALGILAVAIPAAWTIHRSQSSVDYTLRTATPSVPAAPNVATAPAAAPVSSVLDGEPYGSAAAVAEPAPAPIPFESLTPGDVRAPAKHSAASPRAAGSDTTPTSASKTSGQQSPAEPSTATEAPKTTAEAPVAAAPNTLDQEMSLLKRAHQAEAAGRPTEALSILAEHAKEFPNGKLAESRDVARVIALCDAGQKEAARAAADRFLAARPNSPFANRVRGICAK